MTTTRAQELALACVRGDVPVVELVELLALQSGKNKAGVMFGAAGRTHKVRLHFKGVCHFASVANAARREAGGSGT